MHARTRPIADSKTKYEVHQCPRGTCSLVGYARMKHTTVEGGSKSLKNDADKRAEEEETNEKNKIRSRLELEECSQVGEE